MEDFLALGRPRDQSLLAARQSYGERGFAFFGVRFDLAFVGLRNFAHDVQSEAAVAVFLLGYADQAHFSREFRRFDGLAPSTVR